MENAKSLALVESAIVDCENEIAKLDQLAGLAAASQKSVTKLETDIADVHFNRDNLEQKARASRLTTATSLLTLERGDLAAFQREVDKQTDRAVQYGNRATSLLQELWSAILHTRKEAVEEALRRTLDLSKVFIPVEMLVTAAFSVIEITELGGILFQYRSNDERDLSLNDARLLRTRSASLIGWARELSHLELNIVDVELTPAPKPKSVVTGNQLGTMAQAVAA